MSAAAVQEFGINRGAHHRMSWLQNTYDELVAIGSYEVVGRAYILITCHRCLLQLMPMSNNASR